MPTIERVASCELAPPGDVGDVAERADHGDARALVGIGELVGLDLDLDAVQRGAHRGAEQRLVALVVGVGDEGDARGEQLGAGGLDVDRVRRRRCGGTGCGGRRPASSRSSSSAWATAHLKSTSQSTGASDWYASPRARLCRKARCATRCAAIVDGGVGHRPVDRQPERAPQLLERRSRPRRSAGCTAR